MEITEAKIIDGVAKIKYSNETGDYTIAGRNIHKDFYQKLEALQNVFDSHIELENITVQGVTKKDIDGALCYVLIGVIHSYKQDLDFNIKTAGLFPKLDEWFDCPDPYDEDFVRLRENYPFNIDEEETMKIVDFLDEAEAFVEGKRAPNPQGDLFTACEEVTPEDMDIEKEQLALPGLSLPNPEENGDF